MIYFPEDAPPKEIGGKAAALKSLRGFMVPEWFVTTDGQLNAAELNFALQKLGGERFAVRSSAKAEDGAQHSFAGQYSSFLNVKADDVLSNIRAVQAETHSERLEAYRKQHGIADTTAPAVIVQKMLNPRVAGVAFSADPISGSRKTVLISATAGTGERLVSGEVDGEQWRWSLRDNPICESRGDSGDSLLTDEEVRRVGKLAKECARHFSRPQDIEWAIEHDTLYLLQSRPITTLSNLPDPDDPVVVWDNSNIAESYPGLTSPLTFSFARHVYEHVYREFCRLLKVPSSRLARLDQVFPEMLGYIRHRVYYNLCNWYRVLAVLPGYRLNRSFMEQMMGVKTLMPEDIVEQIARENKDKGKFSDALSLMRMMWGLLISYIFLPRQIKRFYERLSKALASPGIPWAEMSGNELAQHYRELETRLLRKWDAPLVNDFFAMIFVGVLKALSEKWLRQPGMENELLADTGDIISAELPRRLLVMAELTPTMVAQVLISETKSIQEKMAALESAPELDAAFNIYLREFGDRCLEELKLESPVIAEDPSSLLTAIGTLALRKDSSSSTSPENSTEADDASQDLWSCLPFFRRHFFTFILKNSRRLVRNRENLRFERTRLFGRVRQIFRHLGEQLVADNILHEVQDVFFLEKNELLGVFCGARNGNELIEVIEARRRSFEIDSMREAPPDRFQSQGPLHRYSSFIEDSPLQEELCDRSIDELKGLGACPGSVDGVVRVIHDPRRTMLQHGEILVAQQTDPGWVVLFPLAAAIIVERGSMLSHSAIVAREMGIPCVVSVPRVTRLLATGDRVSVNGSAGTIKLITKADNAE